MRPLTSPTRCIRCSGPSSQKDSSACLGHKRPPLGTSVLFRNPVDYEDDDGDDGDEDGDDDGDGYEDGNVDASME